MRPRAILFDLDNTLIHREAAFQRYLERLAAAEALFVGDDPLRDIAGAHTVGLPTCWIAHGRRFPPQVARPDVTAQSVLELELERVLA